MYIYYNIGRVDFITPYSVSKKGRLRIASGLKARSGTATAKRRSKLLSPDQLGRIESLDLGE